MTELLVAMCLIEGFAIDEMGFRGQFEQQQFPPADVRFGSQADIGEGASDVRFTSNSRHPCPKRKGPAQWPVPPRSLLVPVGCAVDDE